MSLLTDRLKYEAIIDRPKLSPKRSYKIDKLLIMGFIIKLFQKRLKIFII